MLNCRAPGKCHVCPWRGAFGFWEHPHLLRHRVLPSSTHREVDQEQPQRDTGSEIKPDPHKQRRHLQPVLHPEDHPSGGGHVHLQCGALGTGGAHDKILGWDATANKLCDSFPINLDVLNTTQGLAISYEPLSPNSA